MKRFRTRKIKLTFIVINFIIIYSVLKIWLIFIDFNFVKPILNKSFQSPFNVSSIEYILNSNLCLFKKPKLIILVTSHAENFEVRNIIRQSYPKDIFHKFSAQIIFLLATIDNSSSKNSYKVQNEFKQHTDIVQGNFIEAYRNLTYKHIMGLSWTKYFCTSVKYFVKMDDDIAVNYYKLFEIINKYKSNFQLMGHVIKNMEPIRNSTNKWYVSEQEYKGNLYPSFLSGWFYVGTIEAINLLLMQVHSTRVFWIDDVFITGILREKTNINLTDTKQWYRYEPKSIECCILNKYSCDFLAAPNGKNYSLNVKLHHHLWECRYKRICVLEQNIKISCLLSSSFP